MAIITIPTLKANSMSLQLVRGDTTLEFFDGSVAVVQSTKALWVLSVSQAVMGIDEARDWQAALIQLAKPGNQMEITPPGWVSGTGYSGSQGQVAGAGQLGTSLNVDTLSNNQAISLAGDFISVNGEFKCLTQDASSNGSGAETFNFEPALRTDPPNNDPVDVKTPIITMRLITPQAAWSASLPLLYSVNFEAIEHFGI